MEGSSLRRLSDGFVASLGESERARAVVSVSDASARADWYFAPRREPGLLLREMSNDQVLALHDMMAVALGQSVYQRAIVIIALERLLREREHGNPIRDPSLYATRFFVDGETTGWRFQGHHLSLNVALRGDTVVSSTPFFLGANPSLIEAGGRPLVAPLQDVEDAGRSLFNALSSAEAARARIVAGIPGDMQFGPTWRPTSARNGSRTAPAIGGELARDRLRDLLAIVDEISPRPGISAPDRCPDDWLFAWAGDHRPGQPLYFHLRNEGSVIEYHNAQDGGRHAHFLVRDVRRDFADSLASTTTRPAAN